MKNTIFMLFLIVILVQASHAGLSHRLLADESCSVFGGENLTYISACSASQVDSSGTCQNCSLENCLLCNANDGSKCDICVKGLVVMSDGSCGGDQNQACLIQNCDYCFSGDGFTCLKCQNNLTLVDGKCPTVAADCFIDFCIQCNASNAYQCATCTTGYTFSNGACSPSTSCTGQLIFDGTSCSCPQRYYPDSTSCTRCSIGSQCSDATTPTQCPGGQRLQGSQCIDCPEKCLECSAAACLRCQQGFAVEASICSQIAPRAVAIFNGGECFASCQNCNATDCTVCLTGFYKESNSLCIACPLNCEKCSNNTACQKCFQKFFLNQQNCDACSDTNCLQCSSASFCFACTSGFEPLLGVCKACPSGCDSCFNGVCKTCLQGYVLLDTVCSQCIAGCKSCSSTTPSTCATCYPGTFQSNGECIACPSACEQCTDNTTCTICFSGFVIKSGSCVADLGHPCLISDGTTCTTCFAGYTLANGVCSPETSCTSCTVCPRQQFLNNGICTPCTTPELNCQRCDTDGTTCIECIDGMFIQGNSANCASCHSSCATCMGLSCTTCASGYYMKKLEKKSTGICLACPTSTGCEKCLSEMHCIKCADGYVLFGTSCRSSKYIVTKVQTGATEVEGFKAMPSTKEDILTKLGGFYLQNPLAVIFNKYDPTNGYQFHVNIFSGSSPLIAYDSLATVNSLSSRSNQGFASECTIERCFECNPSAASQCLTCRTGFVLSSDKTSCAVPTCQGELVFSDGECTCIGNTFKKDDNTCGTCATQYNQNCKECSTSSCTRCLKGYFVDGASCTACSDNCKTCTSATDCTKCKRNYFKNTDGTCKRKASRYKSLVYLTINGVQTKASCKGSCIDCDSQLVCNECPSGQYPKGTRCKKCPSTCKSCSADAPSLCTSCFNNFILENGFCATCTDSNCLSCTGSSDYCVDCKSGYYASTEGKCVACNDFCMKCTNSTICSECQNAHAVVAEKNEAGDFTGQMKCVQCASTCSLCNSSNLQDCIKCQEEFYIVNGTSFNTCDPCLDNCKLCSNGTSCQECSNGFRLSDDGSGNMVCDKDCNTPCLDCPFGQYDTCLDCISAYTLNSTTNTCALDLSCNTQSPPNCQFCSLGYYLSKNKCFDCKTASLPSNCIACNTDENDAVVCADCVDGFYLSASLTCSQCPSECTACETQNFCTQCLDGYMMEKQFGEETGICIQCDADKGCKTCSNDPRLCKSCLDGYNQKGSRCVTNQRVVMSMVVNTDIEEFGGYSNGFLVNLAILLFKAQQNKQKYWLISFSRIQVGSFNADVDISVPSDETGDNVLSASNTIDQNTNLGGVSLASAPSITTEGFVVSNSESNAENENLSGSQKIGLILGLVIPLAIIVIVIIVIFAVKGHKNRYDTQQSNNPYDSEGVIKKESDF